LLGVSVGTTSAAVDTAKHSKTDANNFFIAGRLLCCLGIIYIHVVVKSVRFHTTQ
jgi:hypothetical protein